jgi:hypothetical protein
MPGIADLQPAQVQANSLNAIDGNVGVNVSSLGALPELQDFMAAYKQGVITADDIRKRQTVGNTGNEAERDTNLARSAQAQQATIEASDIQPLERALKKEQIAGATTQQTLLNQMNDPNPEIALPAQEAFVNRQHQIAAVKVFGTATPKLEVNAGVEPEGFDDWVNRQVNHFQGTDTQRAAYETNLRLKGEKGEEYSTAVKAAKSRTRELTPGTPEYDHELRVRTDQALTHEQLQAIQLDTLKEFGKAQATAAAKSGDVKAEAVDKLAKEYNALPALHDFDKVDAAYNKLIAATDASSKPSPLRDQAAIFSWMKILDPGSTVREGEYASVKNAKGIPDKFRNWYNQALTGQILTPEQRIELREASEPVYQGQIQNLSPRIKQYLAREKAAGLSPGSVVPLEHRALIEEGHTTAPVQPATATASGIARPTVEQASAAPTFQSPAQVPNTVQFFKSPDGKLRVNPAYRP